MKKKILLSTVVAAALATSALADNTFGEVTGSVLKGTGLNNYHTNDVFSIYANPANLAKHKNVGILEMGTTAQTIEVIDAFTTGVASSKTQLGGASVDLGGAGTLAVIVGREDTSGIQAMLDATASAKTGAAVNEMEKQKMTDILYATEVGGMTIGARFSIGKFWIQDEDVVNIASDATNIETTTLGSWGTTDMSFALGLKMKKLSANIGVDLASAKSLGTTTDVADNGDQQITGTTFESTGGAGISANVQYDMTLGKTDTLITAFYKSSDLSNLNIGYGAGTTTIGGQTNGVETLTEVIDKYSTVGVDAAFKLVNSDDTKVTLVTGVTMMSQTEDGLVSTDTITNNTSVVLATGADTTLIESKTMKIPFIVAVEKKASEKLTWRAGVSGNIYGGFGKTTTTSVYKADKVTVDYTSVLSERQDIALGSTITTGVTYNVAKNLDLTAVVSKDFWLAGPLLWGNGGNDFMAQGAVTFNF